MKSSLFFSIASNNSTKTYNSSSQAKLSFEIKSLYFTSSKIDGTKAPLRILSIKSWIVIEPSIWSTIIFKVLELNASIFNLSINIFSEPSNSNNFVSFPSLPNVSIIKPNSRLKSTKRNSLNSSISTNFLIFSFVST